MKIVVLTNNGSVYGKKILNDLTISGVDFQATFVIKPPLKYYRNLFKFIRKRISLFDALYFCGKRLLYQIKQPVPVLWKGKPFVRNYADIGRPIVYVKDVNSRECLNALEALSPDIIILGQTGIVKWDLLRIAKVGVLNAHPAILPYYRGIDCSRWAIYKGEFHKIGASVHWVDRGVDTGNVITKKAYAFVGNETLEGLDDNLYDLGVSLITQVVCTIDRNNIPSGERQIREDGNQYFKMPRIIEYRVKKKLREFLASNERIKSDQERASEQPETDECPTL
jgi:folate-dependent phosphoribosylglycinamide formyltransferase PurN